MSGNESNRIYSSLWCFCERRMKFVEKKEQTKKLVIRGIIVVCSAIILFIAIEFPWFCNVAEIKNRPIELCQNAKSNSIETQKILSSDYTLLKYLLSVITHKICVLDLSV